MLLNFIEPTSGTALIGDIEIPKFPTGRRRSTLLTSLRTLNSIATSRARQNLSFFAKLGGRKKVSNEELDATLGRVGLPEEAFTRRVKTFSKGMRQRLGIAIAIMKNATSRPAR